MGAWGTGLYSNDDAADFLSTVRAVLKLPLPPDELVDLLRIEAQDAVADQTTANLIIADQFEKYGVHHPDTFMKAIKILETGQDIEVLRIAESDEKDLRGRAKSNQKLIHRLRNPRPGRQRKTHKKPQPAVATPGDYICFPIQFGCPRCIYDPTGQPDFQPEGWGLVQIHDVGWELGYLNWVQVLPLKWGNKRSPTLQEAVDALVIDGLYFGVLSRRNFKVLGMQIIGNQAPRLHTTPPKPGQVDARFVALNAIPFSYIDVDLAKKM